jgi:peptidyl-prolyl cis-trans isomerase D
MLRGIHKASSGWLGKGIMTVIMGLLAISFAIWGIGDIFRGFGRSTFATIGDTEIGIVHFRNFYNDKINQLGRRVGRPINPEQARALGLDRQILGELVAETTLDEKAKQLKLGVSDAEISNRIMADPNFQGVNGQFDRGRFQELIRQAGFTEPRFVQEQRQLTLRRQIALSLTGDLKAPVTAQSVANLFRNEKRNADVLALGAAQAGDIPPPTPEQLSKYFEERKASFRAPETRKIVLLLLTPAEQARWATVSDEDAKAYYEQRKADYGTPERRHLRQIVFPNAEEAKAASEKIAKGASFDDIVKERGLSESDVDLGTVGKRDIIDPTVADAAFALKDGEVSQPVEGRFGTVILQASQIEPARQRPYEEVAPAIKTTIAQQRARNEINELRDKIEDDRAAGATLAETASKLKLATRTIDAIDRSGRDAAGNPVPNLPQGVDVINAAFNSDVGVDSEALQIPGGGFLWYDVVAINRSRERTLDEVRDQVETRWKNDEIAARLKAKADDMLGKLKGGATLAQVAAENNLTTQPMADLQRGQPKPPLSAAAVEDIFRTAKGAASTTEGDQPATRVVFVVTAVNDPKLDAQAPETKQLADALGRGYGENILSEYVAKLESELGVHVNQSALQQIVGGGSGTN